MRQVAIYLILDEAERPRYVGRTFNPARRPLDHFRRHPEWAKTSRILETVSNAARWQDRERYWIAYYRRFTPLENLARGGGSAGPKSPQAIRLHREKMLGFKHSRETLARIAETWRRKTPEERAAFARKVSVAKKGKVPNWSPQGKAKLMQAAKNSSGMTGRHHSAETRRVIGEKGKGRPPNSGSFQKGRPNPKSDEWRRKVSLAHKGKRISEETKAKLRAANLGKRVSAETKRKMSAAQRARYSALDSHELPLLPHRT